MEHIIAAAQITAFMDYLRREERSDATIQKYGREVWAFHVWLQGRPVSKELVSAWKEFLSKTKTAGSVNCSLTAIHSFLTFLGWEDCKVKYLKVQRRIFRDADRELTKAEYTRLVETAKAGNPRLALLLETICATGVRVSEVKYITVEAVQRGRADISLKGKVRTILLPGKLVQKLKKYARKQKIASGEIFVTKSGKGMSRRQIWGEMKRLCRKAGVEERKVFPHNLRHLFARCFYRASRDIVRLADVLGHSSIETTRIYLITTETEHSKYLNGLGLVS